MHLIVFTVGHGSADKSALPLPQRVVEPLDVAGLTLAFARGDVLSRRQHDFIGFPEISVEHALLVSGGNALPQQSASHFAAVANRVGNTLTGAAALSQPDPLLVLAFEHKGPEFIDFQAVASGGRQQCFSKIGKVTDFF